MITFQKIFIFENVYEKLFNLLRKFTIDLVLKIERILITITELRIVFINFKV